MSLCAQCGQVWTTPAHWRGLHVWADAPVKGERRCWRCQGDPLCLDCPAAILISTISHTCPSEPEECFHRAKPLTLWGAISDAGRL